MFGGRRKFYSLTSIYNKYSGEEIIFYIAKNSTPLTWIYNKYSLEEEFSTTLFCLDYNIFCEELRNRSSLNLKSKPGSCSLVWTSTTYIYSVNTVESVHRSESTNYVTLSNSWRAGQDVSKSSQHWRSTNWRARTSSKSSWHWNSAGHCTTTQTTSETTQSPIPR